MDFLMEAFRRNLSEFKFFQFKLEKDDETGNYTLTIWDHPIRLDLAFVNLMYEDSSSLQKSNDNEYTFIPNYISVFDNSPDPKSLVATFHENDYAKKINKIAHTLRDFRNLIG